MCIYISCRRTGSKSICIFEVSTTNKSAFKICGDAFVVSYLNTVLVSLHPLHGIHFDSSVLKFLKFSPALNYFHFCHSLALHCRLTCTSGGQDAKFKFCSPSFAFGGLRAGVFFCFGAANRSCRIRARSLLLCSPSSNNYAIFSSISTPLSVTSFLFMCEASDGECSLSC